MMNKEEIRKACRDELESMEHSYNVCCREYMYRYGKIAGMLKAFMIAGMITMDDLREIMHELF